MSKGPGTETLAEGGGWRKAGLMGREGTYKVCLVVSSKKVAHERAAISCDDCHLLYIAEVSMVFKLKWEVLGYEEDKLFR